MVEQKNKPEQTEKPEIEILSKKLPDGNYSMQNVKVTLKDDTFGNPEYAFFNDKQILYITQGNPKKYGRNTRSFDSVASKFDIIKNYVMNIEFNVKTISVSNEPVKYITVTKIELVEKLNYSTDIEIIDSTEKKDNGIKTMITEKIKKNVNGVTINELTEICSNPIELNDILKELKDNSVIEVHNGLIKYIGQKTL